MLGIRYLLLMLCCFSLPALAVIETYEFETEEDKVRYQHFTEVLRCPKCQNQNLSGSNSPIAKDLRRELAKQIQSGASDDGIVDFMVSRYGDYVLYDPQFKNNTLLLWLAPGLFLLTGALLVWGVMRGRNKKAAPETLSDEERQRLEKMLKGGSK